MAVNREADLLAVADADVGQEDHLLQPLAGMNRDEVADVDSRLHRLNVRRRRRCDVAVGVAVPAGHIPRGIDLGRGVAAVVEAVEVELWVEQQVGLALRG